MDRPTRRRDRLPGLFAAVTVLCGLVAVIAGWQFGSINVPWGRHRISYDAVMALGALTALMGAASGWFSRRFASTLAAGALTTAALGALGYHPPRAGDILAPIDRIVELPSLPTFEPAPPPPPPPVDERIIWMTPEHWQEDFDLKDDHYGVRGQPLAVARDHCLDFDVVYHFDEQGWRAMPPPQRDPPVGEIVFLGCSMTFGIGVPDELTYPARLAGAWPQYQVRNYAYRGWGTVHAWLALDELLRQPTPPKAVFYGWIHEHLRRNALRASFHQTRHVAAPKFTLAPADADPPYVAYQGTVPFEATDEPDTPDQDLHEMELTRALWRSMYARCQAQGIPFFVVLLMRAPPDEQAALLADYPGPVLDLSELPLRWFFNEGHPDRFWHHDVAHRIASDPRIAKAVGDAALLQPAAIGPPPVGWTLHLFDQESRGLFNHAQDKPHALRIERIACPSGLDYRVRLFASGISLARLRTYKLKIELRADRPRPVTLTMDTWAPPAKNMGLRVEPTVGPQWQSLEFKFVSRGDESNCCLALNVGQSDVPVEIGETTLTWVDGPDPPLNIGLPVIPDDPFARP